MGRPRTFNEDSVLDAAAGEFRRRGFADTSTEELCEATGMGRGSLYNAFVSKDELFRRALDRFIAETYAASAEIMETEDTPAFRRFELLLDRVIQEEVDAAASGGAAGCMVVGTLLAPDLRARDSHVAESIARDVNMRRRLLAWAASQGHIDGSISVDVTPNDAAWLVIGLINGIRVNAQAGASGSELAASARLGLRALSAR
ncbi:AcrR family transcriptional regulator [Mycetocola sp. BIGb0189]|uniref:TetR/AcrR family transcriptional regulator n=1 Tax=Mycetocola sp. BIGb0189 TaxID=2940604 RepID=UPI002169C428|nr:TetR/AcrR family transcriptional regulator [Mycetocola sp. BIGb0189]MCS4276295.1 AcrR family transcriptional regulator [Mycetocola sp. BIGb0189]